jgi:hypothetical protein
MMNDSPKRKRGLDFGPSKAWMMNDSPKRKRGLDFFEGTDDE